jgi:hypothetical protein
VIDSRQMSAALKPEVVPYIRSLGCKGSLPRFYRETAQSIDLLEFQYNKWGGSFRVNLARASLRSLVDRLGVRHPPKDMHISGIKDQRDCLRPFFRFGDYWFSFETEAPERVARSVLRCLKRRDPWAKLHISDCFVMAREATSMDALSEPATE